jgi:LPXTG-motif cell wall-anchored protein
MGTTIFYIIGTMLVIGAGVVLVTRRRMDAQ